jgi:hypothetical protein
MTQNQPVDIASLLHLVNFMIFGYLIRDQYLLAFGVGVVWELLERWITNHPTIRTYLIHYLPELSHLWDETTQNKQYDLLINMIGYYLGNQL